MIKQEGGRKAPGLAAILLSRIRGRIFSTATSAMLAFSLFASGCGAAAAAEHSAVFESGVLRATLANGLRVVIVRDTLAPVVTTEINYLVGSDEAPDGFPGMAHAQEHMMFRGSPGLSADQLASITAEMGGNFDADTQQAVTQYYFTVPAEDLDLALHIEAIRMHGVLDSDALWSKERGAIEQEVAQDLSSPQYVFYTKLLAAMFRGSPYAHDALGTRPSFEKTTGAMLKDFHDTWYTPNNAILVIVGNIEPGKTLHEVERLFGNIPARKLPPRPAVALQPFVPTTLNMPTDLPYGLAVVAFRMPGLNDPDFAATQVLADVLNSERGTLYALVPAGRALYAGFSLNQLQHAGIGYALAAFPKGDPGPLLVERIQKILADDIKHGFSADLVAAAKRRELASAEFEKNSVSGLAGAWSEALAVEGRNSPDDDLQAIARVSVADVDRVARKYLILHSTLVAVLTPQSSGKPVASKGFGGKESFAGTAAGPVILPGWARTSLRRLEVPKSTVHPVVSHLANGILLIVQPESISNTISIFGHIRNNSLIETPPGKEGVNGVLSQLFDFGTTSLDRIAFQKALDGIAADESAGTDFSLGVLSDNFDRGVELLADNELHPALPEAAFKIVQRQAAAAAGGLLQSPDYLTGRALGKALYPPGDPFLRQTTPATVSALTMQDVKNYYHRVFRPDMTTIVVIGKISPALARQTIEKYFGGWRARGPKPNTLPARVAINKPSATVVPDSSRIQDSVTLAVNLGLTRSNPDYYALQLGNHVLGGAFYATRLYRDLREQNGLVYYVASSFTVDRTRAVYSVEYACDPPNVSRARAIVMRDLRAMQTTLVKPDELRRAKALLLREIPLSESSLNSIAGGLIARVDLKLPLDEPTIAAHRYLGLTSAAVKAAYARWLMPANLVQITEGPMPH
ncbi:MAG: M16 family metallopeptidase [Acidiferrobacterales bacterium]